MATPVSNFGLVTVSIGYTSGSTSIVLTSGHGSRLPATFPYPMVWWDATLYANASDDPSREIVLVTARTSDTLTVTRAQEGTSASNKNTSSSTYRMSLSITKAMWESLQTPTSQHYGLQLQTHQDANLASTEVELVDVESIIMNDGVELRNDNNEWSGKVAAIGVSGAGGLDSGTIAAFNFYEIYAIAKEDGTRALLLHLAPLWAINIAYSSGGDADQPIRATTSNTRVAQGVRFGSSGKCPFIGATLRREGSPTGNIWIEIQADAAGAPSGTALARTPKYDVSRIPTTYLHMRIPIRSSPTFSATPTQYWLVAYGDYTIDGTNYIAWHNDGSAGSYAGGSRATYNGSTWSVDSDDDLLFSLGLETNVSAITLPSGYTKHCFLGWVNCLAGPALSPFLQVNQMHFKTPISQAFCNIGTLNGQAQVFDLVAAIPPRHMIKTRFALTGTGSGAAVAAIGDLRATDISFDSGSVGAQVVLYAGSTTVRPAAEADVVVQTVAVMAKGTQSAQLWVTGFEW